MYRSLKSCSRRADKEAVRNKDLLPEIKTRAYFAMQQQHPPVHVMKKQSKRFFFFNKQEAE